MEKNKLLQKSIFFIGVLTLFCLCIFPVQILQAATLDLASLFSTYNVGDVVNVKVLVSSTDQAANAVSGTMTFDPSRMEALSTSKSGSIINIWATEPSISNAAGTIHFEGVDTSGFQGSGGTVLTATFRVKSNGTSALALSGASVLANDGQGTDILTNARGLSLAFTDAPQADKNPIPPTDTTTKNPTPQSTKKPSSTIATSTASTTVKIEVPGSSNLPVGAPSTITVVDDTNATGILTIASTLFVFAFIFFVVMLYLYYILREIKNRYNTHLYYIQLATLKSFKDLDKELTNHLELLKKVKNDRNLTREEEAFIEVFEKHLFEAEKDILKEVKRLKKR